MDLKEIYDNWEQILLNSKENLDAALQHTKNLVEAATTDEDREEAAKVIKLVNSRIEQVDIIQLNIRKSIKELSLLMHNWVED